MTSSFSDQLLELCQHTIKTCVQNSTQQHSPANIQALAQKLYSSARRRKTSDPAQLLILARNQLNDGPVVEAMLNPAEPTHQKQWERVHALILRWLHARGTYPCDDLILDERAPDIATLSDLKRALPEFDHACQLDTFIITLTQRRAQMWLRDRAATKRGGEGIYSRAHRRQQQQVGETPQRRRDHVRYLSELVALDGNALEELIGASEINIAEQVEDRALYELIMREAHVFALEQGNDLILKIWYATFIEMRPYKELAQRYHVKASMIAILTRQFKDRLHVALTAWLAREEANEYDQ